MPIPAYDMPEKLPSLRLVMGGVSLSAEEIRELQRRRVWAFLFDAILVQGFCLYFAKFFVLSILALHSKSFSVFANAKDFENFFLDAYQYGIRWVWAGGSLFAWLAYSMLGFSYFGKSFGMALLGLELVDENGTRPDFMALFLRVLGLIFSLAAFGLPLLISRKHKSGDFWHDRWSNTYLRK